MLKYVKIVKVAKNCNSQKVNDFSVYWNDSFRKIFGFNRWEAVTELSPFVMSYLLNVYDLCKWNFLHISNNIGTVALFIDVHNAIDAFNSEYGKTGKLRSGTKNVVWNCFAIQFGH